MLRPDDRAGPLRARIDRGGWWICCHAECLIDNARDLCHQWRLQETHVVAVELLGGQAAEQLFTEASEVARRTLGAKHPMTRQFENSLVVLRDERRAATNKSGAPENKRRDER